MGYVSVSPAVSEERFNLFTSSPTNGMLALLKEQAKGGLVGGFMNVAQVHHDHIAIYTAGVIDGVKHAALDAMT